MNKGIRIITALLSIVLTARIGKVQYDGHIETWYDLDMANVVARSDRDLGVSDLYWIRDDGCKMYGPWIILASHESVDRYSLVETSLGTGIVLDRHTTGDPNLYDIAVDWR